ncbi:hypothetical protein T10_8492 [Trichinella papuae]|uniref:Uncharacterized protein n=1 Tax=Trichinella papuae TaxID=268474 RepID=A0A0V1M7Z5_9BILA|nr:hypothetical protein T10_8492 [Trichinella papuae]
MQITIAIKVPYRQYKEWSKEKVKTRTTRSKSRTARCTEQERKIGKCDFLCVLIL